MGKHSLAGSGRSDTLPAPVWVLVEAGSIQGFLGNYLTLKQGAQIALPARRVLQVLEAQEQLPVQ